MAAHSATTTAGAAARGRRADRIVADPIPGRVAAPSGTGSYLLWRAPGQAITVDGRFENYRPSELRAAYDMLDGRRNDLIGRWNIQAVITRNPAGTDRLSRAGFRVRTASEDGYLLIRR